MPDVVAGHTLSRLDRTGREPSQSISFIVLAMAVEKYCLSDCCGCGDCCALGTGAHKNDPVEPDDDVADDLAHGGVKWWLPTAALKSSSFSDAYMIWHRLRKRLNCIDVEKSLCDFEMHLLGVPYCFLAWCPILAAKELFEYVGVLG